MTEFNVPKVLASNEVTTLALVTGDESGNGDLLRDAVGGWLEALNLRHPQTGEVATLWMDEEGKFKDGNSINWVATALADTCNVGLMPGDHIVGDVVLTGTYWSDDPDEGALVGALSEDWHGLLQTVAQAVQRAGERQ